MTAFTREELYAMLSALCYVQTIEDAEGLDAEFRARFPESSLVALLDAFDRCGEHLAYASREEWAAEAESQGAHLTAQIKRQMAPPSGWTRAELREATRALAYALTPAGELTDRFAWCFESDVRRGDITAEHVTSAIRRAELFLEEKQR